MKKSSYFLVVKSRSHIRPRLLDTSDFQKSFEFNSSIYNQVAGITLFASRDARHTMKCKIVSTIYSVINNIISGLPVGPWRVHSKYLQRVYNNNNKWVYFFPLFRVQGVTRVLMVESPLSRAIHDMCTTVLASGLLESQWKTTTPHISQHLSSTAFHSDAV